jgi:hypothetical protein
MEVESIAREKSNHEPSEFCEVDTATARAAYRSAFESLRLTQQQLLLGKVDEVGDVLWSGCPRWVLQHPRTRPTVEGIREDIVRPDEPTNVGDEQKAEEQVWSSCSP